MRSDVKALFDRCSAACGPWFSDDLASDVDDTIRTALPEEFVDLTAAAKEIDPMRVREQRLDLIDEYLKKQPHS